MNCSRTRPTLFIHAIAPYITSSWISVRHWLHTVSSRISQRHCPCALKRVGNWNFSKQILIPNWRNSVYFQVHWNCLSQGVLYRKNALYRMISRLTGNRLNLFSEFYKSSWMLGVFKKCIVFVPNTCCFEVVCNVLTFMKLRKSRQNARWNHAGKPCDLRQISSQLASFYNATCVKTQCNLTLIAA